MPCKCRVPRCRGNCAADTKVHVFKVPREKIEECTHTLCWQIQSVLAELREIPSFHLLLENFYLAHAGFNFGSGRQILKLKIENAVLLCFSATKIIRCRVSFHRNNTRCICKTGGVTYKNVYEKRMKAEYQQVSWQHRPFQTWSVSAAKTDENIACVIRNFRME